MIKEHAEILLNKLQRMAAIENNILKPTDDTAINKSVIDDLNYGMWQGEIKSDTKSTPITVPKKGKEIKAALQKEVELCTDYKMHCFTKMELLVTEIDEAPVSTFKNDYLANGWVGKLEIPLQYAWEQIYTDGHETANGKKMREFNEHARQYLCSVIEEKKLQTLVTVIEDSKIYQLTVEVAAKLGF